MKRLTDVIVAGMALIILAIPLLMLAVLVKLTSPGPVIFWSDRVGRHNRIFRMPKFRTMRVGTPCAASHLLLAPERYLTSFGGFLRTTSLDELPQLFTILSGTMSIVGPRPALFNQDDLIALRTARGVHELPPGLTGWAQVNGRDDMSIEVKADHDEYYLHHRSFLLDLKIILLTVRKVLVREGVTH